MSSQGVSRCWPSKDFSGLSRASIRVPFAVSITMRVGVNTARLFWPGKSTVSRSLRASAVKTTFLRKSPLPFTYQMAPVIDAATLMDLTLFHRSRPPCAVTARSNSSFIFEVLRFFAPMLYWRVAKLLVSVRFFRLAHDLARRQLRFRAQKKTGDGLGCELRPPPFYDKFEKITVRLRTPIGRYADAALAP